MQIDAIVVDIDGTLTDQNRVISVKGIETLRRIQADGVIVSLASGNVLPVAYSLSTYIGLKGPIIAENGGIIYHNGKIIELFDRQLPNRALEHLQENMAVRELFTNQWRRTEIALKKPIDIGRVRELLKGWDVVVECAGFAVHIMNTGHGKGTGVHKMAQILNIDASDIAAFGDSDNDVSMFRECGASVAVENASNAAKAAASYVSPKKCASGVIDGLHWLGLL
ncbi:MAG: phosphoglycolate phosphatase [Euryarchaeota archaeon]|nr:phosphoglycolate phosphatase [Euryarchaeota archaeon]